MRADFLQVDACAARVIEAKLAADLQLVAPLADHLAQIVLVQVGLAALVDDQAILIAARQPDVVISAGDAGCALADISAVNIPRGATSAHIIRQGEALNVGMRCLDANGRPIDIEWVTIESWLERAGEAQIDLSVTKIEVAAGTFEISRDADLTMNMSGHDQWVVRLSDGARTTIRTGTVVVTKVA